MKRAISAAIAALVLAGGGVASASAASAHVENNGICDTGEVCFYSQSGYSGYMRDTFYSAASWRSLYYHSTNISLYSGADGDSNNVSSAANWDTVNTVRVYYNSNYSGPSFQLQPYGIPGWTAHYFSDYQIAPGLYADNNMNSHHFAA